MRAGICQKLNVLLCINHTTKKQQSLGLNNRNIFFPTLMHIHQVRLESKIPNPFQSLTATSTLQKGNNYQSQKKNISYQLAFSSHVKITNKVIKNSRYHIRIIVVDTCYCDTKRLPPACTSLSPESLDAPH